VTRIGDTQPNTQPEFHAGAPTQDATNSQRRAQQEQDFLQQEQDFLDFFFGEKFPEAAPRDTGNDPMG